MLAKLARELPLGEEWFYEPKWDAFRCLGFRAGDDVDLRSRNDRPLARYFPELVEAFALIEERSFVVDGEIVVTTDEGFDFSALMSRLHPAASRVERLRHETPASFVAFDVLAVGGDVLLLFDAREVLQRVEERGDVFAPVLELEQSLPTPS